MKYDKDVRVVVDLRGLGLDAEAARGKVSQVMDEEVVCVDFDDEALHHLVIHTKRLKRLQAKRGAL